MFVSGFMSDTEQSSARERVLDVAERLFSQRGFASVTMRDIATQLSIKVSSLYYHAPNGKEELFVAVMQRNLQRHRRGLAQAIQAAGGQWQQQLLNAAHWMLAQPALDMHRFIQIDQHALSKEHVDQLTAGMYSALFIPLESIFITAQTDTGNSLPHPGILAGTFISIIEGFRNAPIPDDGFINKAQSVDQVLGIFIKGLEAK